MQTFYSHGFLSIIIVCLVVLCLASIRKNAHLVLQMVRRGILGFVVIVIVNRIFLVLSIPLCVGVNVFTILASAFLGIPGVCMLYGIQFL